MAGLSMQEIMEMAIEDAEEARVAGNKAVEAKQYTVAIEKFTEALELLGDSGVEGQDAIVMGCLVGRGGSKSKQGDHVGALSDFGRAALLDPTDAGVLLGCGQAHEELGDLAAARKQYELAESTCKGKPSAEILSRLAKLGKKPALVNNPNGARTSLSSSLVGAPSATMVPTPPAVLRSKEAGNDAYKRGQFGDAIDLYTAALDGLAAAVKDSSSPLAQVKASILTNRAVAALKDGQLRTCCNDCAAALLLDPRNQKAFHRRASANEQREKYKDAVADFAAVLQLNPSDSLARRGHERAAKAARQEDPSWRPPMLSPPTSPLFSPVLSPPAGSATAPGPTLAASVPAPPSTVNTAPVKTAPAPAVVAADSASAPAAALAVGTWVVLHGLSKPELNGRAGAVSSELNEKGRQTIRLDGDSKVVALKPVNFKSVPPTSPAAAAGAPPRLPDPQTPETPSAAAAVAPLPQPAKSTAVKPAAAAAPAPASDPVAPARSKSAGKPPPGQRQSASAPQLPAAASSPARRPSKPVPKVPMSMATAAELALFPVDQLVAHVLEHRRKEADQADAINRLKAYTESLLDKIMASHPEILQTTGTK